MITAFAYVRVSTGEQARGYSLLGQYDEIERFCEEKEITVVERFSDSMSGTKLTERDGLMTMIDKIDELRPKYIIATETDRISRNTLQFGWIDTHLSMKGTKLLLVNESQVNDPAGKAFQKIRVVFSEFENDLRQWRIKRGRVLALAEKQFMNRPPFGYYMKSKDIIINPQEKVIVQMIFDQYCERVAVKQIARNFHKMPSTIRYILRNRFYIEPELNGRHIVFIKANKYLQAQERLNKSRSELKKIPFSCYNVKEKSKDKITTL
jgi:site-specific DNA recombinase